ncbi:MAG: hypothetical protein Faunusvirus10_4 [Faunusvirus sp.]|jgi:hypothetical protein|uniref:Uncharacterized protein n=1 Tax=Faunusvirus sp. TaxID=2487766 RepID=A0A3G4ZZA7_9VIRU|nr:MAG: hypothetical protein Faunusvirus10_4 [Faunusvirus sp.]
MASVNRLDNSYKQLCDLYEHKLGLIWRHVDLDQYKSKLSWQITDDNGLVPIYKAVKVYRKRDASYDNPYAVEHVKKYIEHMNETDKIKLSRGKINLNIITRKPKHKMPMFNTMSNYTSLSLVPFGSSYISSNWLGSGQHDTIVYDWMGSPHVYNSPNSPSTLFTSGKYVKSYIQKLYNQHFYAPKSYAGFNIEDNVIATSSIFKHGMAGFKSSKYLDYSNYMPQYEKSAMQEYQKTAIQDKVNASAVTSITSNKYIPNYYKQQLMLDDTTWGGNYSYTYHASGNKLGTWDIETSSSAHGSYPYNYTSNMSTILNQAAGHLKNMNFSSKFMEKIIDNLTKTKLKKNKKKIAKHIKDALSKIGAQHNWGKSPYKQNYDYDGEVLKINEKVDYYTVQYQHPKHNNTSYTDKKYSKNMKQKHVKQRHHVINRGSRSR